MTARPDLTGYTAAERRRLEREERASRERQLEIRTRRRPGSKSVALPPVPREHLEPFVSPYSWELDV